MQKTNSLNSRIDKAIFEYKLLEDGDKILIGASGGKDSTALIEYFSNRKKRKNANFEFTALYIQSDFAPPFPPKVLELYKEWNVNFVTVNADILNRVHKDQKMSCYWCSTQRRYELMKYAMENGFNKIALGHHLDDILETLLMNMLNKGELCTMPPILQYEKYPLQIIRPLCYVPEERIILHAQEVGYAGYTCTCNYQDNSARKSARKKLEELTGGDEGKKDRMFAALKNIKFDYLPKSCE